MLTGEPDAALKVPVPLPRKTDTLPGSTGATMSGLPSPLTSPVATELGLLPPAPKMFPGVVNPPDPLFSNTTSWLSGEALSTRSRSPSPSKSALATPLGPLWDERGGPTVNPPVPLPVNTVRLFPWLFAVTRSGMESPVKSPVAIASGPIIEGEPNGDPVAGANDTAEADEARRPDAKRAPTAPMPQRVRPREPIERRPSHTRARSRKVGAAARSGRRVSNPRPRAWEARALPAE